MNTIKNVSPIASEADCEKTGTTNCKENCTARQIYCLRCAIIENSNLLAELNLNLIRFNNVASELKKLLAGVVYVPQN